MIAHPIQPTQLHNSNELTPELAPSSVTVLHNNASLLSEQTNDRRQTSWFRRVVQQAFYWFAIRASIKFNEAIRIHGAVVMVLEKQQQQQQRQRQQRIRDEREQGRNRSATI